MNILNLKEDEYKDDEYKDDNPQPLESDESAIKTTEESSIIISRLTGKYIFIGGWSLTWTIESQKNF